MPNKSQIDILMIPQTDLEIKVIKKFVKKNKQDRFLQFISTSKNRQKFTNSLAHFDDFEWTLFKEVSKNQEQTILEALQKNKITTTNCYIISEDTELDTQIMEVTKAIHEVIGQSMGTILVFGDAEIIYYEGEGMKSRYISNRLVAL